MLHAMGSSARDAFVLALTLSLLACPGTAAPSSVAVEPPGLALNPGPPSEPEPAITCASAALTIADESEARALASLLEANPIAHEFSCPVTLAVAQREPWHVPTVVLAAGEADDLKGPTARPVIGERVTYWGLDSSTGDLLLATLGRVDEARYAEARTQVSDAMIEQARERDPEFELPESAAQLELGLVGEGLWRGLSRTAISGARARALRDWLTNQGELRHVRRTPLGLWEADPDRLGDRPWLLVLGHDTGLTVCVDAADEMRCWSCDALELVEARESWSTDEEEPATWLGDEEADLAILTLRTRAGLEVWRLRLATGTWTFLKHDDRQHSSSMLGAWPPAWHHSPLDHSAPARRGKSRRGPPSLDFEPSSVPVVRPEVLATTWLESPAPGLVVGGSYKVSAVVLVPEIELFMQQTDGRWRGGHPRGGVLASMLEWPDSQAIVLVTGFEAYGNDRLGYAGHDLQLLSLTPDGEWLRPAGRLPLPLAAMAQNGHLGGWGYAYDLSIRGSCLRVELAHSMWWWASGKHRRLELPFEQLRGDWNLGPEGLTRGCEQR